MADLGFSGIFTGIDTGTLVKQLIELQKKRLYRYEDRKGLWEERRSALNTLQGKLTSLRNAVRALSDADELKAYKTTTSDSDILTAEASYNAFEGNHTVVTNQLASAERWVHTTGIEYPEDTVGAGTFTYSYNHQETSVTTTAETTLEELAGLINNDANNPGVTASLLRYNDMYHLVLNGNDAGTDYEISINASNTEVWQGDTALTKDGNNAGLTTKITDLDTYEENGGLLGDEEIRINGTDRYGHAIAQVELRITSNTRVEHLISEIEDAFDGNVKATFENGKIVVTDKAAGASSLFIELTYYPGAVGDTELTGLGMSELTDGGTPAILSGFAESDFTKSQAAQDSKIKVDGFPSDSAVSEKQTMSIASGDPDSGHYHLTYNGQTTEAIAYDAGLSTIQDAIDALSNVNSGDITVTVENTHLDDGEVYFTFSDTLGDVSMIQVDDSALSPATTVAVAQSIQGVDAYISRSSNTIDDVIHGVTLHLHDTTEASGEEVSLTRNIDSVKEKLTTMVEAYNAAVMFIQENTGYDTEEMIAGVLMGDYTVSSIRSQMRNPLYFQTSGFTEETDSFLTPGHIGLELDRDGMLSFDTNIFDEATVEHYLGVLSLIGADKTGSNEGDSEIDFYGASSRYTTAGTYEVHAVVIGGVIDSAQIRLEGETEWRDATWVGNTVTGNLATDDNGVPVYPEHSLQFTVDLTNGDYTATIRVKQGFAGAIEDAIDDMLHITRGTLTFDIDQIDDNIEELQDRIEDEEHRLTLKEARLKARFARLEKALALLQNQVIAMGLSTS